MDLIAEKRTELLDCEPLNLIVIDTLAKSMQGADENKIEDMSRVVATGERLIEAFGAHVAFVHHSGKNASLGARGHSSLKGACSTEIEVTADEATKLHTIEITKQRDLNSRGMKLTGRFKAVELGRNQWDKPVSACVVLPVEEPSEHMAATIKAEAEAHAERVVLAGFKALRAAGIAPSDKAQSGDYLPKKLGELGHAQGLDRKELANAMHRLMGRSVFRRGVVGKDSSRHDLYGLVLGTEP